MKTQFPTTQVIDSSISAIKETLAKLTLGSVFNNTCYLYYNNARVGYLHRTGNRYIMALNNGEAYVANI